MADGRRVVGEHTGDNAPPSAADAGSDKSLVLDKLCIPAPSLRADGGTTLRVQSEFACIDQFLRSLRIAGITANVPVCEGIPCGPVLHASNCADIYRRPVSDRRHCLGSGSLRLHSTRSARPQGTARETRPGR